MRGLRQSWWWLGFRVGVGGLMVHGETEWSGRAEVGAGNRPIGWCWGRTDGQGRGITM